MKIREKRVLDVLEDFLESELGKPTTKDFNFWISSLLEPMRTSFKNKGILKCQNLPEFQLFVLKRKKPALKKFFADRVSPADYHLWTKKDNELLEYLPRKNGE